MCCPCHGCVIQSSGTGPQMWNGVYDKSRYVRVVIACKPVLRAPTQGVELLVPPAMLSSVVQNDMRVSFVRDVVAVDASSVVARSKRVSSWRSCFGRGGIGLQSASSVLRMGVVKRKLMSFP